MAEERTAAPGRRAALGAALVAAALTAPAGALAVPAVLAPVDVSAGGASAGAPLAGMAADGGLVVVWPSRGPDGARVMAATRPPGGPRSDPAPLSAAAAGASAPALAVAPSGAALAAWRAAGAGDVVQAAARAPGGPFAAPVDLSAAGAFAPEVALAPDGGAAVAWLRFDGDAGAIVAEMARRPPGGAFTAPGPVSAPGGDVLALTVAAAPDGRVAVAWNQSEGRDTVVRAAVGTLSGGLADPVTLSAPGEGAHDARVALTPAGTALVAWAGSDGGHARVRLAEVAAGVAHAPATLSAPGADATDPRLAVDADGTAVVAWRRGADGAARVQATVRPPGGPAQAAADLSAPGAGAAEPAIAVDGAGRAAVAWRRAEGTDPRVQVAVRDPGRAFAGAVDVSTRGTVVDDPGVALDGAGNGVVVWRRASGDDDVVQMAGLDDAPPVLHDLAVPATAVAGVPVRLGARARDVWSTLSPGPIWSFAAGAGALGASVEHAFPAAGAYVVRVAQADAVGRVAVAERRVDVVLPGPAATLAAPPAARRPGPLARRPVALRAGWSWVRRGERVWLRVRGVASPALRGRAVVVERRAGRRALALCRVPVRARGGFDGRCRVDRLARRGRIVVRVRARVTASRTTRARALAYVTRRTVVATGPSRARAR